MSPRTPKIVGFTLEVTDDNAFYEVWKRERTRTDMYFSSSVEFGASPIRDKNSMMRFINDMSVLGLTYMVYPITR
jgi:hypothetical protein